MPLRALIETLADGDGYGKIMLTADATGALAHASTILYIRPKKGESLPAFLVRLQRQVQPGDQIELALDKSAVQLARLTRAAAAPEPLNILQNKIKQENSGAIGALPTG